MPKENFFTELQRRNVFKVASIYAVTAWLVIQVVATTFPIFEFPAWSQRWVIILALVGFPVALVLAWAYEVVPDKQARGQEENAEESTVQRRKTSWLGYVAVLLIGIIGTALYFNRIKGGQNQELLPASIRESRIAVLPYENKTNDGQLDILGDMTADWIIQGMMNLDELKVVSYQTIKDHVEKLNGEENSAQTFQELTGAEKIIRGSFYKAGDQLIFQSQIIDVLSGDIDFAFPEVKGNMSKSSEIVEEVSQRILSHLVLKKMKQNLDIFAFGNPPKYEAFLLYEEQNQYFGVDYQKTIELLEKSIEIDSSFYWAYHRIATSYGNMGQWAEFDSMVQVMDERFLKLPPWEKLYMDWLKLWRKGDLDAYYLQSKKLLEKDPKNVISVYLAGLQAGNVNRPATAVQHLESLPNWLDLFKNPSDSWFPAVYAANLIRLDRLEEAQTILNRVPAEMTGSGIYYNKLRIFVLLNQNDSIHQMFQELENQNAPPTLLQDLYSEAIEWYALQKDTKNQMYWVDQAITKINNRPESIPLDKPNLAMTYFYSGQYDKALPLSIALNNSGDVWWLRREGYCRAQLGQKEEALKLIGQLKEKELADPYQQGEYKYAIAGIYSGLGDKEKAVQYLKEAFKNGRSFNLGSYRYAYEFIPLHGYEPFDAFVKPRD